MVEYFEHDALRDVYLEDSWVLDIQAGRGILAITAEFVLTPGHEFYSPRLSHLAHCYRLGVLVFDGVTDLSWTGQLSSQPSRDEDGSVDYGNIDSLEIDGNHYLLEGDLGVIDLHASSIRMVLSSDPIT